jgi:two-component system NtrC family sensor kinase
MTNSERGTSAPATSPLPKVLVVDDVAANLKVLEAILETLNCHVVPASSGNEALRLLLRDEFAVLILDVQMPDMDGYEVAHHVRQNPKAREVPIIFLTAANRDDRNVLRGYGSGAVDFLFKPADSTILRSKVRVFLDLYANRRQIADAKRDLERAYEELKATQSRLVQSAKMASLGELVAGVAHEINNPLAFCIGHVETARKAVGTISDGLKASAAEGLMPQCERATNRLNETRIGLERIRELVVKLRTFSRVDEGERKVADVKAGIESVLFMLEHRSRDRIQIQTDLGEPTTIECYPGLLNQAVMNLVSNAIDAIEGPGNIHVASGANGGVYFIRVTDSGKGILPEHKERVFEPFFTTKPVGQGTGLGLAITYSIAQRHDGTLELDNAPSGGTVATLSFPLSPGKGPRQI